VVLAEVTLDPSGIRSIDNTSCRRMVISFATTVCPPFKEKAERDPDAVKARVEAARKEIAARADVKEDDLADLSSINKLRDFSAVRLADVQPDSRLGKRLAAEDWTIADVGSMPKETFVKRVSVGVPKNQIKAFQEQARTVWTNGAEIMKTITELNEMKS
jgi:hypothetical protein